MTQGVYVRLGSTDCQADQELITESFFHDIYDLTRLRLGSFCSSCSFSSSTPFLFVPDSLFLKLDELELDELESDESDGAGENNRDSGICQLLVPCSNVLSVLIEVPSPSVDVRFSEVMSCGVVN